MEGQTENFLRLLGGILHPGSVPEVSEPADWDEIMELGRRHNVPALVFEAASEYSDFTSRPEYPELLAETVSRVAEQTRRTENFLNLYRAFLREGLAPVVVKGLVCRTLYGELCDHRPSGDEDILIQKEQLDSAVKVLKQQGFQAEMESVTSEQLEKIQELTFFHPITGLQIELHINPMGTENEACRQMNRYFETVFERGQSVEIDQVPVAVMSPTDHFLFLVLHALRHFTGGGLGIRQPADILLFAEKFGEQFDIKYLTESIRQMKAEGFLSDLIHIGNQYLGFRLTPPLAPVSPDELLQDLINSGTFGNGTQGQRSAVHLTSAAMSLQGKRTGSGKMAILVQAIFPGKDKMMAYRPEIAEKPGLLYVEWVKRWGRFLKHSRENKGSLVRESMQRGERRLELLKKYKII